MKIHVKPILRYGFLIFKMMNKIFTLVLLSCFTLSAEAELVLVSGKVKQKNYIDTASVSITFNPRVVSYDQLIFIDKNDPLESWRNSVVVNTMKMNCQEKTFYYVEEVRKSWDRTSVIESFPAKPIGKLKVAGEGPSQYVYDRYC